MTAAQSLQFSKTFFSILTESLLTKLSNPVDKYNLESVINYYSSVTITEDFCFNKTSENKVLIRILKNRNFKVCRHTQAFRTFFTRWS